MTENDKYSVGTRVHVFSPDRKEDWGLGTIDKIEPLECEGDLLTEEYPSVITLDSGKVTQGLECWWIPIEEAYKIALELVERLKAENKMLCERCEDHIPESPLCNCQLLAQGANLEPCPVHPESKEDGLKTNPKLIGKDSVYISESKEDDVDD